MSDRKTLDDMKRRHAAEVARLESEIALIEQLIEYDLWLDYMNPSVYDHGKYVSVTIRMPHDGQLAGVFSFWQKATQPGYGEFICPDVGLKVGQSYFRTGHWDFDWGIYSHRRSEIYEYMPVFPIMLELDQREVERTNLQGGNYFAPNSAKIRFLIRAAGRIIQFSFEWQGWHAFREFGLLPVQWQGPPVRRINSQLNGWEVIRYQGGHDLFFIPMSYVWANGMGWEIDLLGYEPEGRPEQHD